MTSSKIFTEGYARTIEKKLLTHINKHKDWLSEQTADSTRAVGDGLQKLVADGFEDIVDKDYCKSYSKKFTKKGIEDLAFEDYEGNYCGIDVKTHRLGTKFNMPNLTSVERISRFYESEHNYFVLLIIEYEVENLSVSASKIRFLPIEYLSWDCLTIGALGWGQIQIANSNRVVVNNGYDRATWMIELCDVMLSFYPKEIAKIDARIRHFEKIKAYWQAKQK